MKIRLTILTLLFALLTVPLYAQSSAPGIPNAPTVAWDGRSPINVLILGMDRRPGARDTLNVRTDSIMIARLDPVNDRVGVLHIPRDMHLGSIDLGELVRVNTLMIRGERMEEGSGAQFAMDTIQLNFGMYIDAYVAFDFQAFIELVDYIGGVTIDVPYPINDPTYPDMNYGFDPFYVRAGVQDFDGSDALKYARTRHQDNDYLRGERQLQVIDAVRQKLADPELTRELILGAPQFLNSIRGHVYSNLTPEQMLQVGLAVREISADNFHFGVLNRDFSFDYSSSSTDGVVRVPDREQLPTLLTRVFGEEYWR